MTLKFKILVAAAMVASMSAGFWLSTTQTQRDEGADIQGRLLSPPRTIAIPSLKKDNGSDFVLDDIQGGWHLFFFGYTHCPDICPNTMNAVSQAKKMMQEGGDTFPQVIFVSVDPERDSLDALGEYVRYFDKDFIGVTGEPEMIKAMTLQVNISHMKMLNSQDNSNYAVAHSSSLLLFDPDGRLAAFLNSPHVPDNIIKDIKTVAELH